MCFLQNSDKWFQKIFRCYIGEEYAGNNEASGALIVQVWRMSNAVKLRLFPVPACCPWR